MTVAVYSPLRPAGRIPVPEKSRMHSTVSGDENKRKESFQMRKTVLSILLASSLILSLLSGCGKQGSAESSDEIASDHPVTDTDSSVSGEDISEPDSNRPDNNKPDSNREEYTVENASLYIPTGTYTASGKDEDDYFEIAYIEDDLMYLYLSCDDGMHTAVAYALGRIEESDSDVYQYMVEAEYVDGWGNHEIITMLFDCIKKRISVSTKEILTDPDAMICVYFSGYYSLASDKVQTERSWFDGGVEFYPEGVSKPDNTDWTDETTEYDEEDYSGGYNSDEDNRKYWYDLQFSANENCVTLKDVFSICDVYWDADYTYCRLQGMITGTTGYMCVPGYYALSTYQFLAGEVRYSSNKDSFVGSVNVYDDYLTAYDGVFSAGGNGQQSGNSSSGNGRTPAQDGFTKDYTQYEYVEDVGIYVIGNVNANHKPFSLAGINTLYYENGYLHFSCFIRNDDVINHYIDHAVCFYDKDMNQLEYWDYTVKQMDSNGKLTDHCIEPGTEGIVACGWDDDFYDSLDIRDHNAEVRYIWVYVRDYYDSTIWDD